MGVIWLFTGLGMGLLPPVWALYVTDRFGVDYAGLGAVSTSMALGMMVGHMLGGPIADRIGYSRLMALSLCVTVPAWVAMTWATSAWFFAVLTAVSYFVAFIAASAWEALGADAVLLIARILEGEALAGMLDACFEASVEAFVEVHDERELERALEAGADLIGVNNRDLATLEVDLSVVERLRPLVPEGVRLVSESGCRSRGDVERLSDIGVDAVLIGGALMEASNTEDKFAELFGRE
jgi:hypothetical protein